MFFQSQAFPTEKKLDFVWLFFHFHRKPKAFKKSQNFNSWLKKSQIGNPADWISGKIVSLEPDTDIQKLLLNGNRIRIRISETILSIFRGFRLLEKVAHCTIIHLLFSEASFQPSVPWLRVCLWCNLCTVV